MMLSNHLRRGLAFVLAFAMTFFLVPVTGFATETEPVTVATTVPETEPTVMETTVPETEPVAETTAATEAVTEPMVETEAATEPEEVSEIEPVTKTVPVDNSTVETDATEETESPEVTPAEQIQSRIQAILTQYGVTAEMTDNEIAAAIAAVDGDTLKATMDEMDVIEQAAVELSEEEIQKMDISTITTYERFCSVMESLFSPVPIAAKTVTVLDGKISVTDSSGKGSVSDDIVTITAKGSLFSSSTNNITITNSSGSKAKISFYYKVSTGNYEGLDAQEGSYPGTVLDENATITFSIKGSAGYGTTELTLSDFSCTPISSGSTVVFQHNALGSITIDGTTIASGNSVTVPAEGVALVAKPTSGASFIGWMNTADHSLVSTAASFTMEPTVDMTVEAVFVDSNSAPHFRVNTQYLYDNLDDAVTTAQTITNKNVILANSGTLPAGTYTIPSGVTFLIPFDSTDTCYTTTPEAESASSQSNPTAYRTLTMAEGANITVNGIMSVSAKVYAGDTEKCAGMPKGTYGHVVMNEGSTITVNSGATLSVSGYVTGDGMVTANSGSKIYETFQIMDFRGGSATVEMNGGLWGGGNDWDVFILSQYYIQNIEAPMKIYSGATETVYAALYMSSNIVTSSVAFVAKSNAMFSLTDGYLVKRYDKETDKMVVDIHGDLTISSISMKVSAYTINSNIYVLPINNMKVNINSGTVTVGQDMALIPGTEIIVGSGANFVLGSSTRVYVYDSEQWGNYCSSSNAKFRPLKYVPNRTYTRTEADLLDAVLHVEGTVDASAGSLYTTESGAAITGEDGGQVIITPGTETVTYQATQSGTSISYPEIPITSAKLKNAVEAEPYTATASNAGTYNYKHGKWILGKHTVTDSVIAPTCTEKGYTTHTCVCGYEYQDTETSALGHTEVSDTAVAATCTETGLTEGKHCSACGTVLVAQEEVPALGHNYTGWTVLQPVAYDAVPVETGTCVCGDTDTRNGNAAKIGDTKYETLKKALEVEGDITLLANISGEVPIQRAVTITKNGFNIESISSAPYGYLMKESNTAYTVSPALTLRTMECYYRDEVVLRLKFVVPDELLKDSGATIVLTKDGRWGNVTSTYKVAELPQGTLKDGTLIYYADAGVASGEMTRDVSVTATDGNSNAISIIKNDGTELISPAYCVRDYVIGARKQFTGEGKEAAQKAAAEALAVYGGYAQTFFNVSTDDLAYSIDEFELPNLSGITAESLADYQVIRTGSATGITVKSFEPYLDSALKLRLRFALSDGADISNYTFALNGNDVTESVFQEESSGRWCVDITNIPAAYIDNNYTVTVTTTTDGNTETYIVEVSVAAWVRAVLTKSTETAQAKMAQALYYYAQACSTLFEA